MSKLDILVRKYCKEAGHESLENMINNCCRSKIEHHVLEMCKVISVEMILELTCKLKEEKLTPAEFFVRIKHFIENNH